MRAEVFEIAVSALSFHGARLETPRIVQAARAVLVDGVRPGEAATQFDLKPERVSEAVGRIRDKWAAICSERGLVTETFSLSPLLIELIRQIELEALQPLQADVNKRKKKPADPAPASKAVLEKIAQKSAVKGAEKSAEKKPGKDRKPASSKTSDNKPRK